MKRRKHSGPEAGYTLVEIIAVLVVAAIVLPAIILPFRVGVRELQRPAIAGHLALLAQEEMEKKVVAVASFAEVTGWVSASLEEPFGDYGSTGVVDEDVSFGPVQTGLKLVTVTVTHSGSGQAVSLTTVRSDWRKDEQ